jgi:hypothetical protein
MSSISVVHCTWNPCFAGATASSAEQLGPYSTSSLDCRTNIQRTANRITQQADECSVCVYYAVIIMYVQLGNATCHGVPRYAAAKPTMCQQINLLYTPQR